MFIICIFVGLLFTTIIFQIKASNPKLDLLSHLSPTTLFIQATSYLSDRKQCVKLGQLSSQMLEIYKGVLQGSILGPILLKILLTIFFFLLKKM